MLTLNSKSYFAEDWEHAGKGPRINVTLSRGWGSQTLDHWVHQQLVKRTSCSCGYLSCGQADLRCVTSAVNKLTSAVLPQQWTSWPQVCYLSCGEADLRCVTSGVWPQVCYLSCEQADLRCVTSAVEKLTSAVLPQLWTSWPQLCYLSCGQVDVSPD